MKVPLIGVGKLLLGLGSLLSFLILVNQVSDEITLIKLNRQKALQVDAYFYSEVGDLQEFLDDEQGRYGKRSLGR